MLGSRATVRISSSAARADVVGEGQRGGLARVVDEVGAGRADQRQQRGEPGGEVDALDAVLGHRPGAGHELLPAPAPLGARRGLPRQRQVARHQQALVVEDDVGRHVVGHALQRGVRGERLEPDPLVVVAELHAALLQQLVDGLQPALGHQRRASTSARVRKTSGGVPGVEAAVDLVRGGDRVGTGLHLDGDLGVLGGVGLRQPAVGGDDARGAVHREAQGDRLRAGRARRRARGRRAGGGLRVGRGGAGGRAQAEQQGHDTDCDTDRARRVRRSRRGRADTASPSLHRDGRPHQVPGPTLTPYRDTPPQVSASRSGQPYAGRATR